MSQKQVEEKQRHVLEEFEGTEQQDNGKKGPESRGENETAKRKTRTSANASANASANKSENTSENASGKRTKVESTTGTVSRNTPPYASSSAASSTSNNLHHPEHSCSSIPMGESRARIEPFLLEQDLSDLPETFTEEFHGDPKELLAQKMQYRELKPGMKVSVLGLGTSSLGGSFGDEVDWDYARELVTKALRSGINWIDTAPWYGNTKAEKVLGYALQNIPRSAYYVATKVGRYEPDVSHMFDFSYSKTKQSISESLERVGCGYFDLIQVHDPEFSSSLDMVIEGSFKALFEAREQKLTRMVGTTGYPLQIHLDILERMERKKQEQRQNLARDANNQSQASQRRNDSKLYHIDTCFFYCRYGLHDTSLIDVAIDQVQKYGAAVLHASPLGMGLHTNRGPPEWHPATPDLKLTCSQAAKYCKERGVDISKLAVYFCVSQPKLPVTVFSTADQTELETNLDIARPGFTLARKELECLNYIQENFFKPLPHDKRNWEGREVKAYREKWNHYLSAIVSQSSPSCLTDDGTVDNG